MPRLPYVNFHDLNLDWVVKELKKIITDLSKKQDAPTSPGTPGQVLGLDQNQTAVWINQSGGVSSYDDLTEKPSINGVTLSGELDSSDLGLIEAPATPGTSGQVLTADGQGGYAWADPSTPEVSIIRPLSGNTFTLEPCPVSYAFGEKAELNITVTANSEYHFAFSCPIGTPTVLTMTGVTATSGDVILEAGGYYDIIVWNGIALYRKVVLTGG